MKTPQHYLPRLIDRKVARYLDIFGAISLEGPKWCGKTWTALHHAHSSHFLDDEQTRAYAQLDLSSLVQSTPPILIDEWFLVPQVWDFIRHQCDARAIPGQFLLTSSTTLPSKTQKEKIHHSGAGRIARLQMYPMSLFESGDSSGAASLLAMHAGTQVNINTPEIELLDLATFIVRGGWPANLRTPPSASGLMPRSYISAILEQDMHSAEDKKRDQNKMRLLLRSLARNESTISSNKTLLADIDEYETPKQFLDSNTTLTDYLDVLQRLHVIADQPAYSLNYRSPSRIGKSSKRHFVDPSLAAACLDLTPPKLIQDLKTFGFLFEALAIRDLRIYFDALDGRVYHFRDNVTGLEVDAIGEFADGSYAAFEVKLGFHQVAEAIANLVQFQKSMTKPPQFMAVIVGKCHGIICDPQSGVYIVPLDSLRP